MKKGITSASLILILCMAGSSWAGMELFNDRKIDYLLEELQKQGMLSKEKVEDIKAKDKARRKEHSIKMGVRLQMRYEYKEGDDSKVDPSLTADPESNLTIRRLRLEFKGNMWKDVAYKFEVAADRMSNLNMKDASVTFAHLGRYAKIRCGQFKTPFSRQRITSSSKLQMIDRSPIQKLYPGRDIGFELSGKNDFLNYAVAMEAGVGDRMKFKDTENTEWWYDGRIAVHPFGEVPLSEGKYSDEFLFEVAANGLYAPHQVAFGERSIHDMFLADEAYTSYKTEIKEIGDGTKLSDLDPRLVGNTVIWGPELTIRYKGISLAGEYYMATYTPDDTRVYRKLHSEGYFIQGGAFVIPKKLELTARYDRFDRDTTVSSQKDTREYTAGVNYFPSEDHRYKFQLNYIWRKEDRKEIDNNSVVANFQVKY